MLVVEDNFGHIFGGFAPANWELSPKFYGDDSSFVFTLAPKMRVWPSTGYNQHFQYLNLHQTTLPNGLVSLNYIVIHKIHATATLLLKPIKWAKIYLSKYNNKMKQKHIYYKTGICT